ncbi:MAG: sulfotransferase [Pseudomonadales bacterium]
MSDPQTPEWLSKANSEADFLDLHAVLPLDFESLVLHARVATGLDDFGDDYWQEPLQILCKDLDSVAELTLFGRIAARSDLLIWLENRLNIIELIKQHPEITEQEITAPMFIVGLPRSGTSILFEVLAQDPDVGVPLTWESMFPYPPPEESSYQTDPRIQRAHRMYTQWARLVPEFASIHEMGGQIPAECGMLMCSSFISDQIASMQMADNDGAWHATADVRPAYEWHKLVLQVLQWKNPRKRWLLKAPAHQNYLDILLETYPDARIVQTHRDPIKCMASTTNLMACIYKMRSDRPFDAVAFDNILMGEPTAKRLEQVMDQRENGIVPDSSICDSHYYDLLEDPISNVKKIYAHFGMQLGENAASKMTQYLADKPQGKFGAHNYTSNVSERPFFNRYQEHYGVPSEV